MEDLEAVQARHRKELRDLQSRMTNKKKNATKKTRKGVNDECADLERQLKERQAQELAALDGENNHDGVEDEPQDETSGVVEDIAEGMKNAAISDPPTPTTQTRESAQEPPTQQQIQAGKKRNRQKERIARRAAEQEAASKAAEAEAANMTDYRGIEKTHMLREFETHNLTEKEIQPDGHCLFSAIADQLSQLSMPLGSDDETRGELPYKIVRKRATDWMASHPDDFAPFLDEHLASHVAKIRDTAEWGGQLELTALANAYGVEINVVQNGRTETIEPSVKKPEGCERIWLAYYRHGYGLGEHYNSLRKAS